MKDIRKEQRGEQHIISLIEICIQSGKQTKQCHTENHTNSHSI